MSRNILKIITTGVVVAATIGTSLAAPDIIFGIVDSKNLKASETIIETDDIEMTQKESTIIDKMKAIKDVKSSTDMDMDESEKKSAISIIGKTVEHVLDTYATNFTGESSIKLEKKLGEKKQSIKKMLYIFTENDISSFVVYDYKIKYNSGISAHLIFDEGTGKILKATIEGINTHDVYDYQEMYSVYDEILSLYYGECKVVIYDEDYDAVYDSVMSSTYNYKYSAASSNVQKSDAADDEKQDITIEYTYEIIYKNETMEYIVRESSNIIEFNFAK